MKKIQTFLISLFKKIVRKGYNVDTIIVIEYLVNILKPRCIMQNFQKNTILTKKILALQENNKNKRAYQLINFTVCDDVIS